jgi:hypothetical protein
MAVRHNSKSYVVGFMRKNEACMAQGIVHEETDIKLTYYRPENITSELKALAKSVGLGKDKLSILDDMESVVVGMDAHLVIPGKVNINKALSLSREMPIEDFCGLPMSHYVGTILVKELLDTDVAKRMYGIGNMVFVVDVMDPISNPSYYIANLMGIMRMEPPIMPD